LLLFTYIPMAPKPSSTTPAKPTDGFKVAGKCCENKKILLIYQQSFQTDHAICNHVVHPDAGISKKAMTILNSFVKDIVTEASKLAATLKNQPSHHGRSRLQFVRLFLANSCSTLFWRVPSLSLSSPGLCTLILVSLTRKWPF
jgi:hypothetical protein